MADVGEMEDQNGDRRVIMRVRISLERVIRMGDLAVSNNGKAGETACPTQNANPFQPARYGRRLRFACLAAPVAKHHHCNIKPSFRNLGSGAKAAGDGPRPAQSRGWQDGNQWSGSLAGDPTF